MLCVSVLVYAILGVLSDIRSYVRCYEHVLSCSIVASGAMYIFLTLRQIFTQFIIYERVGGSCRHGDKGSETDEGSDDEQKPLLHATANESGLPCFGERGNIQEEDPATEERRKWDEYGITENGRTRYNHHGNNPEC